MHHNAHAGAMAARAQERCVLVGARRAHASVAKIACCSTVSDQRARDVQRPLCKWATAWIYGGMQDFVASIREFTILANVRLEAGIVY